MAQQHISIGGAANDGTGTNWRQAWANVEDNFIELYYLQSQTVNAGDVQFSNYATDEEKIQAAITYAVANAKVRVFVPGFMIPYDATEVTFDPTIQMTREGGLVSNFDISAYGGAADGSDVTPALNAATAGAVEAGGGVVFYPPGFWYHLTTPTILSGTLGVIYRGSGRNVTHLVMGAEGVWVFNIGNAAVRVQILDMWIGTFTNYTTGGGIQAISSGYPSNQISEIILERITLQNLPYPFYWDNVTQAGMRDVRYLQTRADATVGDAFYFIRCHSVHMADVILLATDGALPRDGTRIDSDCDSVFAQRCEMVLMGNGANSACWRVLDSVGAGNNPPRIIRITDCLAENANVGFSIEAGRDVTMTAWESANNTQHGVHVIGTARSTKILHGQSFLNGYHGIYVQSAGDGTIVDGNIASNNSQAANNTYDGIVVAASHTRIVNNRSGDVFFTLTNKQRSGLNLVAASDYLWIDNNDLVGNVGAGYEQFIINASTGANNHFGGSAFFAASEALVVAGVDTQSYQAVYVTTTLTAARVVGAMYNAFKGQRVSYTFIQGGAGGWAVTWNAQFKHAWSDTGNTTGKRSTIEFMFDGTNYNQISQSAYL